MSEQIKPAPRGKLLTPQFLKWESEDQEETGILRGVQILRGSSGSEYNMYLIERDDGGLVKFSLGHAADQDLTDLLALGNRYTFVFKGMKRLEGRKQMKVFEVYDLGKGE